MSIAFSPATPQRFQEICALYQDVIRDMHARGLKQWEWDVYPTRAQLEDDITHGRLYRVEDEGRLIAVFALGDAMEPEYARITWEYGVRPATLHRFAMACESLDLASRVLAFVKEEALRLGYDSLRLDTCVEDSAMLKVFSSAMTREAGRTFFENPGVTSVCFESPLSDACPMLPLRMYPAYRHGDMTPWGGDALRTVYGRDIPDDRTGEALEISAIPQLESRTVTGETLPLLLERDGARLSGDYAGEAFPLLLKLLAARDSLSVQVHPDDAYAREHEGKLGKTEAWVILKAEEGASILYGLKEGVTLEALRAALEGGADVERLIRRVPVKPGDVYYMPSGMVHAIGGGILLYEIQQSSDVTYRLWDFDRVNAAGEKRPLHIRQSLDVIVPELTGQIAHMPENDGCGLVTLLDVPAFHLECANVNGECELAPQPHAFRMLTALAGLLLSWQGDAIELKAGDSVLLPASCPPVTLMGVGQALISTPPAHS